MPSGDTMLRIRPASSAKAWLYSLTFRLFNQATQPPAMMTPTFCAIVVSRRSPGLRLMCRLGNYHRTGENLSRDKVNQANWPSMGLSFG